MKTNPLFAKVLTVLTVLMLVACTQSDEKFKSYSVGFSTPNVKVWVSTATLDNRIRLSAGSIQGAWEEAGATNAVFDESMPREIFVSWEEDETKLRYEAKVKLVDDLVKRAKKLRPVWLEIPQQEIKGIDLIIGLAPKGRIIVWLSNAPHGNNISGRVLEVIGEAQGSLLPNK